MLEIILERISQFFMPILFALFTMLVIRRYSEFMNRRIGKENFDNIDWWERNRLKITIFLGLPLIILGATTEEFAFRLLIIIAFKEMSACAWIAILLSSALFAMSHNRNKYILHKTWGSFFDEDKKDEMIPKEKSLTKLIHISNAMILGIVLGYIGIRYQSLYLVIGLHMAWNLIGAAMVLVIISIIKLFVSVLINKWRGQQVF